MVIICADSLLRLGLSVAGYPSNSRVKSSTMIERFVSHYGCNPSIACTLLSDMQATNIADARLESREIKIDYFLMGLYFLRCYPTEPHMEAKFKVSAVTVRKWTWFYIVKIQAMKQQKIIWPDDTANEIYICSVDGTHCPIQEPRHPTKSKDTTYYSHKFNKAGLNYELGVSVFRNQLVWINGPFPAGIPDITVFF